MHHTGMAELTKCTFGVETWNTFLLPLIFIYKAETVRNLYFS